MSRTNLEIDTSALVPRAAAGDESAWAELVEALAPRVYALLMARCRDADLAEELTQDTFARVAEKLQGGRHYDERGRFEPWLFRVAMNRLRDEARRRKRHATAMDMSAAGKDGEAAAWTTHEATARRPTGEAHAAEDPLDAAARAEAVALLREAVATMSEKDQEILHLRHTLGLGFAEIAETLGEPQGTVLARGHRALGKLRKLLADRGVAPL